MYVSLLVLTLFPCRAQNCGSANGPREKGGGHPADDGAGGRSSYIIILIIIMFIICIINCINIVYYYCYYVYHVHYQCYYCY